MKNDDFFVKKNLWSEIKDELFDRYFRRYMEDIRYTTDKSIDFIDCCAGKEKFDDGNPGLPTIESDIIQKCIDLNVIKWPAKTSSTFIDLDYADDL